MNEAHKESLELLQIVHRICKENGIRYTISGPTIIEYKNSTDFDECVPIVYISLANSEYKRLYQMLLEFIEINPSYSIHDYYNTEQMNSFEVWFVKDALIDFPERKKKESFYYGTRLVITPSYYAGDTIEEWKEAYKFFEDTIFSMNVRAVLKGQPLKLHMRTAQKRKLTNYYIKNRHIFTYEKCMEKYDNKSKSKYLVHPFMIRADKNDSNSLPRIAYANPEKMTDEIWKDIEDVTLWGCECNVLKDTSVLLDYFPQYYIEAELDKRKSQLALNGNLYLWRVQQIQLELLREFDRICRKYNLKYNISFGTLLGAARHGGFIPWDDDIDVTMHYEDFNKLDEIMKIELDADKYYFRCPANETNNHLIFKHLERKGTTYTKPGREKLEQTIGVFIDIFPMYPSAPFKLADIIHAMVCRYWRTALWATVGADSEKNKRKREKYKRMARPGNAKCYENFVRAAEFFHNDKYLKFWIPVTRNPYKVPLVRKSNYTDTIDMDFEGYKFMAPRNYEEVLAYSFGKDWSKYPSVRGRLPSHNAIMQIGDLYEKESCSKSLIKD